MQPHRQLEQHQVYNIEIPLINTLIYTTITVRQQLMQQKNKGKKLNQLPHSQISTTQDEGLIASAAKTTAKSVVTKSATRSLEPEESPDLLLRAPSKGDQLYA